MRELFEENIAHRTKIEQQRVQIQTMLRRFYGPRRDRYDPNQTTLLEVGEQPETDQQTFRPAQTEPKPARPRRRRDRRAERSKLPRTRIVHEVPPEDCVCVHCGTEKVKIGEEISEEYEYVPEKVSINEHVRVKMACKKCETGVTTAPMPPRVIEKGLPSAGMLSHVVVAKYEDHLPLNRQEKILKRSGVHIPRSTLCDWVAVAADIMEPIYDEMKKEILASHIIWTDDTPVPVLDRTRDTTRTARLWVYVGDAAHRFTVFDYTTSRKRDGPVAFLEGYDGFLQADAYAGYNCLFAPGGAKEVGCWAHSRRHVTDAGSTDPPRAHIVLAWIREFYKVEREAKRDGLDFDGRRELRQRKSVVILERFREWLDYEIAYILPKSAMGKALNYALSNWDALLRYCEDGELEPDNNRAERAIRRIAIGRKNWMFAGSDRGGRTAAILMSICASCHDLDVDPWAYIKDVLIRVSIEPNSRKRDLLPDRWKAERQAEAAAAD
jgi:transposase